MPLENKARNNALIVANNKKIAPMPSTYTDEKLLLYIYNELSPQESQVVQYMLQHDAEMNQRFQELQSTLTQLDFISLEPSQTSIDIILEHSNHLEHTH